MHRGQSQHFQMSPISPFKSELLFLLVQNCPIISIFSAHEGYELWQRIIWPQQKYDRTQLVHFRRDEWRSVVFKAKVQWHPPVGGQGLCGGSTSNLKVVQLRMKIFVGKNCLIWVKKKCSHCTKQYNLHQTWNWNWNWIGAVFVKIWCDSSEHKRLYWIVQMEDPESIDFAQFPSTPRPQDSPRVMFDQD